MFILSLSSLELKKGILVNSEVANVAKYFY